MSKVQVNYKSGTSVTMEVTKFTVKVGPSSTAVEWTLAENARLKPLYFNMDEVESIWEVLK